ncbi:MAG: hypothetical protein WC788_04705 [Candidatus Paceibacterota bacterium]
MNKKLGMAFLAIFVLALVFVPSAEATFVNIGDGYPDGYNIKLTSVDFVNMPHSVILEVIGEAYTVSYVISEGDTKFAEPINAYVGVGSITEHSADIFVTPVAADTPSSGSSGIIKLKIYPTDAIVSYSEGSMCLAPCNEITLNPGESRTLFFDKPGYISESRTIDYDTLSPAIVWLKAVPTPEPIQAITPTPELTPTPTVTQIPVPEPTSMVIIVPVSTPMPELSQTPTSTSTPISVNDNLARTKCWNDYNTGVNTCDGPTKDTPYGHNNFYNGRWEYNNIPTNVRLVSVLTPKPTLTPTPILVGDNLAGTKCWNDYNTGVNTCDGPTKDTPYGHNNFYTGRWEYNNIPTNVRLVSILTPTPTPESTPEPMMDESELFKTPPAYRIYSNGSDYNLILPGISCIIARDNSGWHTKECFGEVKVKLEITRDLAEGSWKVSKEYKDGTWTLFEAYPDVYYFGENSDSRLMQDGKVIQWHLSKFEIGESWTKYNYAKGFSPETGKEAILDLESIEVMVANETFLSKTIPGLGITVLEGMIYTMPDVNVISFEKAGEKVLEAVAAKSSRKISIKDLRKAAARLMSKLATGMAVGKLPMPGIERKILGGAHDTEVENLFKIWKEKQTDESGQNLLNTIGKEYGYENGFVKYAQDLGADEYGNVVFGKTESKLKISLPIPKWLKWYFIDWRAGSLDGMRISSKAMEYPDTIRGTIAHEGEHINNLKSGIPMSQNEFELRGHMAKIDEYLKSGIKSKEDGKRLSSEFKTTYLQYAQLENTFGEDSARPYLIQIDKQLSEFTEIVKTMP